MEELLGVYIDLDKIDIPPDARTHNPAKLDSLAADMKENRQLQEIVVVNNGDRYEVVAGVGRVLAARKLGWAQIRASIREELSDFDKARITFAENEEREDADPFYQAAQLAKMMKANKWTQDKLAENIGQDRSNIKIYLALLKTTTAVKELATRVAIAITHLRYILQLPDEPEQLKLIQECKDKDLSVSQVKAIVDKKLGKPSKEGEKASPAPHPVKEGSGTGGPDTQGPPDPLADFWPQIHSKSDYLAQHYSGWGVSYGRHETMKTSGGKSSGVPAWNFWVCAVDTVPKAGLRRWFLAMAEAIGDTSEEENRYQKTRTALVPSNKEEIQQFMEDQKHIRFPQTPAEWTEVETLALQGPSAVFAWTHGPNSLMAQKAKAVTWEDLGDPDPVKGCHHLVDRHKQGQEIRNRFEQRKDATPAPTPPPSGGMGDEEAARRVAALKAKFGRVL